MDFEAVLAAIRAKPTMPTAQEAVERIWCARPERDEEFNRCFGDLLRNVWQLSPCRDTELLTLHSEAAQRRDWGQPVFATDEEILSFRWDGLPPSHFLLEAWTELEWDHGDVVQPR